ncbi:hypothetical protein EV361DRAFT_526540 [Lentinula raphanica]|nr:hypothetical protein EV361DRAFT_526540 [Lentinula raphanica]
MAQFRRTMKSFPQRSEPLTYHGELLLDQQRFQDTIENFDQAIEIEKTKYGPHLTTHTHTSAYILPYSKPLKTSSRSSTQRPHPIPNGPRTSVPPDDAATKPNEARRIMD